MANNTPSDLRYTEAHLWIKENGDTYLIGITDYAQDQLGDILFVDLPKLGAVDADETVFEIESTKTASELSLPFAAEVVAVNSALDDSPELINADAYENWIIEVKAQELTGVLGATEYEATL
jgi:glycine cleavage system H protein